MPSNVCPICFGERDLDAGERRVKGATPYPMATAVLAMLQSSSMAG
jgi:hypothetical protein